MGTLLRARDPKIGGRTVAIKLLKEGIDNEEIRRRFMQEANAAGVLEHENIVRIFDVGEQDGEPFIAMEYIDGETLSQWIRRKEPASMVRKLRLLEELCDGLAYAHSFNIVHRDVKPANLMVEKRRGRLKILDFGIAKLADSGITNAGALIGSFNYMSPEQVRGLPIDHRSDIFSVGAVMFELLAYKQAFPGGLGDGVLGRIAEQPAPKLRQAVPEADPEVEAIIAKALEKDPARRYPDLPAMHRDLTRVRRRLEREESSSEHTRFDMADSRPPHTPAPSTPKPGAKSGPEAERLARMRAEQVSQHLAAAAKAFEAGHFDEAIEHTYRASAVDEDDARPQELRARAQAALDEQQASQFLHDAQSALARGDIESADSFVGRAIEVRPGHTGIGNMREAVARARNQIALGAAMQRARAALQQGEWTAAIRASTEAELYQPGLDEARSIRQRAQTELDEAASRERARLERVRDAVEHARRAIVHNAIDEASQYAEQAARDRADPKVLESLRLEIELARKAIESQARRSAQAAAQAAALLAEANAKMAAGEFRAAIVRCDAALRIIPDEASALDLRRRAVRAAEEQDEQRRQAEEADRRQREEEAAAERRRREVEAARLAREALDRAAQVELDAARREFAAGHHDAAIARLQRFAPPHEAVSQGLAELRAEQAELRAQAEAQARAEAERARAEAEERARRAAEEERLRREEAERQRQAALAQAAEEERQRQEEAERQRLARVARAEQLAGTSRELASAGQYNEALATLGEATRLDPQNVELQELTRQIRDAKTAHDAAERKARDLAAKLTEAEGRLGASDLGKARKLADQAAAIDAQAPAVQALLARIAEAEGRAAQERAARQAAEEEARRTKERDQKVTGLIAKAKKAKKPAEALKFLEEAQRVDPQRVDLPALIAERQAEAAQPPPAPKPQVARPERPDPGIPVPSREPGRSPAVLGGIGAVFLLVVAGAAWFFLHTPTPKPPDKPPIVDDDHPTPPNPPPAVQLSMVSIVSTPWAHVTVSPVGGGAPVTCNTPCQVELAAGDYNLAFENNGLSTNLSERLSVPAGQPVEVRRTLPGFDVDGAVSSIVGTPR